MVNFINLLVVLFFLTGTANGLTSFEFYGDFDCPEENFWYEMQLMEDDAIGFHDVLSEIVTKYSIAPHHFKINGVGDQDGLSRFFEVYLHINHTCTNNGETIHYEHFMGDYEVVSGESYKLGFNINLFNQGH